MKAATAPLNAWQCRHDALVQRFLLSVHIKGGILTLQMLPFASRGQRAYKLLLYQPYLPLSFRRNPWMCFSPLQIRIPMKTSCTEKPKGKTPELVVHTVALTNTTEVTTLCGSGRGTATSISEVPNASISCSPALVTSSKSR